MKKKGYAALIMSAAIMLSSCGAGNSQKANETSASAAAVTTEAETTAAATTTAATTTAETTTVTTEETTAAPSPAEIAKAQSEVFTETFRGEKMTEVKQLIIEEKYALESDVYMFTDEGESLDHIYNAPSTYDITDIVFSEDGTVSLYGIKNRLIPDKVKEIFSDGVIQGLKDKISDKISGRDKAED